MPPPVMRQRSLRQSNDELANEQLAESFFWLGDLRYLLGKAAVEANHAAAAAIHRRLATAMKGIQSDAAKREGESRPPGRPTTTTGRPGRLPGPTPMAADGCAAARPAARSKSNDERRMRDTHARPLGRREPSGQHSRP